MWIYFFFFKQKTAYEMCISDWSSDVCSSDLIGVIGDDRVEASIEVGIQFIIARSELDSVAFDPIAHLEDRVAHTDVQRLRLFTARDRAAIVVGQDDDGHIAQGRIEQSLRADVEIGYVDDCP